LKVNINTPRLPMVNC